MPSRQETGEHSDPADVYGNSVAQRIKGTQGDNRLIPQELISTGVVWHLDVGSSHPGAGEGPKGWAVRPLKWHELGSERRETVRSLSIVGVGVLSGAVTSTRGP